MSLLYPPSSAGRCSLSLSISRASSCLRSKNLRWRSSRCGLDPTRQSSSQCLRGRCREAIPSSRSSLAISTVQPQPFRLSPRTTQHELHTDLPPSSRSISTSPSNPPSASPSTTKSFLGAPTSTPPYNPPTTGLLTLLPRSWIPYAELIRLDKPTGTIYLLFPCLFSTLLFAPLTYPVPSPPTTVLSTCLLFSIGALVMRGAGCTINDLWDRNLDPLVGRTRLRPLARRAVSPRQALLFAAAQLSVGLAVLLSFPPAVFFYATPSLLFVALYPLAKRVTHYPQFVLGLTFSWGALLGFPALGIDPFALSSAAEGPTAVLPGLDILTAAAFLYTSNIAWTVLYDTIYAHMDLPFDRSAGIKSIAVAHSRHAKKLLSSLAVVQIGLLAAAGVTTGAGPLFFAGACGGAAVSLGVMIRRVDLTCVRSCWWWFRYGAWFTGGAVVLGLGGDYVARVKGWYGEAFAAKERLAMEG